VGFFILSSLYNFHSIYLIASCSQNLVNLVFPSDLCGIVSLVRKSIEVITKTLDFFCSAQKTER
jgi:hypothetical protein